MWVYCWSPAAAGIRFIRSSCSFHSRHIVFNHWRFLERNFLWEKLLAGDVLQCMYNYRQKESHHYNSPHLTSLPHPFSSGSWPRGRPRSACRRWERIAGRSRYRPASLAVGQARRYIAEVRTDLTAKPLNPNLLHHMLAADARWEMRGKKYLVNSPPKHIRNCSANHIWSSSLPF